MKLFLKSLFVVLLCFSAFSCRTDSHENQRAYITGKIITSETDNRDFFLRIENKGTIIAETQMDESGGFVLSGPILESGFTLNSTRKIKSFSSNQPGLELSADFLKITIPKELTYIKFNDITLEK